MMGLTSTDIAGITANEAQRSAEDLVVMVGWLHRRVKELEELLAVLPEDKPELPSERRQRISKDILLNAATRLQEPSHD